MNCKIISDYVHKEMSCLKGVIAIRNGDNVLTEYEIDKLEYPIHKEVTFYLTNRTNKNIYRVDFFKEVTQCTCESFTKTHKPCKHIRCLKVVSLEKGRI